MMAILRTHPCRRVATVGRISAHCGAPDTCGLDAAYGRRRSRPGEWGTQRREDVAPVDDEEDQGEAGLDRAEPIPALGVRDDELQAELAGQSERGRPLEAQTEDESHAKDTLSGHEREFLDLPSVQGQ